MREGEKENTVRERDRQRDRESRRETDVLREVQRYIETEGDETESERCRL